MRTIILTLSLIATSAFAQTMHERVQQYVPGSIIVKQKNKEVKVLTKNKTIVELEFELNNSLEEASGESLARDSFIPDTGHLNLEQIREIIAKKNKGLEAQWSYENSFLKGWYYEVELQTKNKEIEYKIDAKTGEILSEELD